MLWQKQCSNVTEDVRDENLDSGRCFHFFYLFLKPNSSVWQLFLVGVFGNFGRDEASFEKKTTSPYISWRCFDGCHSIKIQDAMWVLRFPTVGKSFMDGWHCHPMPFIPPSLVSPKAGMDEASTVNVVTRRWPWWMTPQGVQQCRVHSKAGAIYFAEKHSRLEPVVWDFLAVLASVNFTDVSVSALLFEWSTVLQCSIGGFKVVSKISHHSSW